MVDAGTAPDGLRTPGFEGGLASAVYRCRSGGKNVRAGGVSGEDARISRL